MMAGGGGSAVAGGPALHIPVLGRQAVGFLNVRNGGVYIDGTFGAGGYTRAYLRHLDRCNEMLGPMLASIHNLHYYVNLMREVREALDAGAFAAFAKRFREDRARGV